MNSIDSLFDIGRILPPAICVEMSGNHQGSLDSALKFLHLSKEYGADYLKLQVYKPGTITFNSNLPDFRVQADNEWSKYSTLHDLYNDAHTPWNWIEALFQEGKTIGLPVFASPFDSTAIDFLERLGCPAYKIASPEITDHNLIRNCARTGKPIILSTGLASREDLNEAVSIIKEESVKLLILKCVSAYPTKIKDINVSTIPWLRKIYNCNVGLSDHTIGSEAAFAASALGANLIEKHFKIPGDNSSIDSSFSMELSELRNFKNSINSIYNAVGKPSLEVPPTARASLSGRRSLYVVERIRKGEVFSNSNIKSIRPSYGLHPKHLSNILGKVAKADIEPGTRLEWKLIE